MSESAADLIIEQKDITERLTDAERARFKICEGVIQNRLRTFIEVGCALAEIRDYRLYRETHKTFEAYCRDIFDISKGRAYQQISGYETVMLLEEKSQQLLTFSESDQDESLTHASEEKRQKMILPINERQTRPLTKLSIENQIKAWDIVLKQLNDGKKLTAALVKKAVREVLGDAAQKRIITTKANVESTQLLSKLFKKQYQVMMDIISEEKSNKWKAMKRNEVVRWLKELIEFSESDD